MGSRDTLYPLEALVKGFGGLCSAGQMAKIGFRKKSNF